MFAMRCSCVLVTATLSACLPAVEADPSDLETPGGPHVEFDPSARIIPLPNSLGLVDAETGALTLPEQCRESPTVTTMRTEVLQALDGFGTYKPFLRVTVTEPVDLGSLEGRMVVVAKKLDDSDIDPAAALAVPVVGFNNEVLRYSDDCQDVTIVPTLDVIPVEPLTQGGMYAVTLLSGIRGASGEHLSASATWAMVAQERAPVDVEVNGSRVTVLRNDTPLDPASPEDLESMVGLEALWEGYQPLIGWVRAAAASITAHVVEREDLLIAWQFPTMTVTTPLDPGVAGTPAAIVAAAPATATVTATITDAAAIEAELVAYTDSSLCTLVSCASVGAIVKGTFEAPRFQPLVPAYQVPSSWDDPLAPTQQGTEVIPFIAVTPKAQDFPGARPTIVFGHGITRHKEDLYAIAAQLAERGFASVAIDWVAHGERAVQINMSTTLCGTDPDPTSDLLCFAMILTSDLAITRDNLRQSVLDQQKLIDVLHGCQGGACGALEVDNTRIGFLGQSLGALIGGVVVATAPGLSAAVLNVGGAGWLDVLIDTDSEFIRCPLIDALIDANIIEGEEWNYLNADALCMGDSWRTDPAFVSFVGTARWVLDPAEPGNFAPRLRTGHHILVQEVMNDETVPNSVTDQFGQLLGLTPQEAVSGGPTPAEPTPAAETASSLWLRYTTSASNRYAHASLLSPASLTSGVRGTRQMQADVLAFFAHHLE